MKFDYCEVCHHLGEYCTCKNRQKDLFNKQDLQLPNRKWANDKYNNDSDNRSDDDGAIFFDFSKAQEYNPNYSEAKDVGYRDEFYNSEPLADIKCHWHKRDYR